MLGGWWVGVGGLLGVCWHGGVGKIEEAVCLLVATIHVIFEEYYSMEST